MLASGLALHIASADETTADRRSVFAGVEIGNTDTHRLLAGAVLEWRRWEIDAQLARAEFALPDLDASSTLVDAGLQRDFGRFSLGMGVRRGELQDVSRISGLNVGATYEIDTARLSMEIESRDTKLEPTPFADDLGPGLGFQTGTSRCQVDSMGYQARVDLNRPTWLGFLSFKTYDYRAFDCAITLSSAPGGPPSQARGRALGRRLGRQALDPVAGFASRLIPREAMLLDWSAALGATLPIHAQWIGGAELYRDVESVGGGAYDTALLFASRRLNDTWTMELSLGFSDAEDVADTTFAGFRMSADL
ncbi:MAG: hypothetical protein K0Q92_1293 [Steroidobacteraceae bacterium]|jgi:hypothetical protein|nr:hypothetical protein [Steroidobacteraceae bacterium]